MGNNHTRLEYSSSIFRDTTYLVVNLKAVELDIFKYFH